MSSSHSTAPFSSLPRRKTISPMDTAALPLGSTVSFFSSRRFTADDYLVSEGHSSKGFYSLHINAFYDLDRNMYTGALLRLMPPASHPA